MKFILYAVIALASFSSFAQETINAMFYNLLNFPESSPAGRSIILRNILTNFTKLDLPEDYDKQKLETQ